MADLHVKDPSFQKAIQLGTEVFQYGTNDGYTNVHTVDSALELGQHVNALLQTHDHEAQKFSLPPSAMPKDVDDAFQKLGDECKLPRGNEMEMDMGTILKLSTFIKFILEDILPKVFK